MKVLLLEEGPDQRTISNPPPYLKTYYDIGEVGDKYVWTCPSKVTEQQNASRFARRGRITGGSSAINGNGFLRGLPDDFNEWKIAGNDEWQFDQVLPYYCKLENDRDYGRTKYHGGDGPTPVGRGKIEEFQPAAKAIYDECLNNGHPHCEDTNHPDAAGIGPQCIIDRDHGVRVSTATAYLDPARNRANLTIMGDSRVTRLLFQNRRVIGVETQHQGASSKIEAKETIVCAGALATPLLLMRSGIGPKAELEAHNIHVLHNLQGVGQNLKNHPVIEFWLKEEKSCKQSLSQFVLRYTAQDSGTPRDMSIFTNYDNVNGIPHTRLAVSIRIPTSSGNIQLTSDLEAPILNYRCLSNPTDLKRMREGVMKALTLCQDTSIQSVHKIVKPTLDKLSTAEDVDQYLLTNLRTSQHYCGTCKMGRDDDPLAVVDQHCRVHGMEGLRICDASIMPDIIRAGTNPTCIMIGERVADWVKTENPS